MVADLQRILAATSYLPPAWNDVVDTEPYPFWWLINAAAQAALDNLELPAVQARADEASMKDLRPPIRSFGGAEHLVTATFKRVLKAVSAATRTPPQGTVDVVALLHHRGWEGQDTLNNLRNEHLGPVLAQLVDDGHTVSTCLPLLKGARGKAPALVRSLRSGSIHGLPHEWLDTYWDATSARAMRQTTRHFRRVFLDMDSDIGFGLGAGEPAFRKWLATQAVRLGLFAGLFVGAVRLLRARQPKVLLTMMESHAFTRTVVHAARVLGIPSVSVQHGWIGPTHAGYIFAPPRRELGAMAPYVDVAMPDTLCVYGDDHRSILLDSGPWRPDGVVVTGAPRYDRIHQGRSREEVAARHRLPDAAWVLWATQTHGLRDGENAANVAAMEAAVSQFDAHLIIKLHPSEPQAGTLYRGLPGTVIDARADILDLLRHCQVLVTKNSTVAIEAAALDVPVVVLNLTGQPDAADFVDQGIAVGAYKAERLGPAIRKALATGGDAAARKAYVHRVLGPNDGHAAKRVAQVVAAHMATPRDTPMGSDRRRPARPGKT